MLVFADADAVRPLRHEALRPDRPWESTRFDGDDHPLAAHVVVRNVKDGNAANGQVVAVGTVFPDPPPWEPARPHAWRIRGMATREGWRGRGLGAQVLDALITHAVDHDGRFIWCHARVGALDFYRRAGFVVIGEPFDDGIAPHQSMWRAL